MEERFYDNELKDFLQKETDKHKMFPSDKVWRSIQQELHGKKSWPALTVIALMVIVALTISTIIYDQPAHTNFKTVPVASLSSFTEKKSTAKKIHKVVYKPSAVLLFEEYALPTIVASTDLNDENATAESEDAIPFLLDANTLNALNETFANSSLTANAKNIKSEAPKNSQTSVAEGNKAESPVSKNTIQSVEISSQFEKASIAKIDQVQTRFAVNNNLKFKVPNIANLPKAAEDEFKADEFVQDLGYEKTLVFQAKRKLSRFELEVYATPSISYRKLVDDKTRNYYEPVMAASGPISPIYSVNINDVVRHKPAMGTEIGVGFAYKMSNKLKFKAGLQFNVRKYFIDSYKSGLNVASIAIIRNNRLDTISQLTSISATSGYAETELDSKLYQVSVPIGLQWQVLQLKRFGLSLAGSIQPTLTLNKNVYLLSTDYKFYTDGTSFFRKWNINTSAEINLTYKVGNYNWYLGPQLRYQHLPTYTDKYPIKEHRLDYGLRVGFTKQLFK
jgi:hypothetical protein